MRQTTPAPGAASGADWIGPLALALSIVLLGCNWPVMKLALRHVGPLWMATLRLLLAGLLGVAMLAARRQLAWPPAREWRMIGVIGLCQGALMTGLVTEGVALVGAGRSAILAYTSPIFVIPAAAVVLRERVARGQMAGLALGMAGLLVLFNPFGFDWGNLRVILGNACVLGGSVAMGTAQLAARGHVWRMAPLQVLPFQVLFGGLLLAPAAALIEGVPHVPVADPDFLLALGYIAGAATLGGYWAMLEAARRLPAARMSLTQLTTPVLGVGLSAWLVGEIPAPADLLGLALILAGVGLATVAAVRPAD